MHFKRHNGQFISLGILRKAAGIPTIACTRQDSLALTVLARLLSRITIGLKVGLKVPTTHFICPRPRCLPASLRLAP